MADKKVSFTEAFWASNPGRSLRALEQGPLGQAVSGIVGFFKKSGAAPHAEGDWRDDKAHVANIQGRGDGVPLATSFRQASVREPKGVDHDPRIGSFSTRSPYESHIETRAQQKTAGGALDFMGGISKMIAAFGAVLGINTAYAHEAPAQPAKTAAAATVVAQTGDAVDPESGAVVKKYVVPEIVPEKLEEPSRGELTMKFKPQANFELPPVPGPSLSLPNEQGPVVVPSAPAPAR